MPASPVLLDLDGTLIDSLPDIAASANHVRAAFGLAPVALDTVRTWVGDGAMRLIARALADATEPVAPEQAWPVYDAHHRDQCTRLVSLYPGVRQKLAEWSDDHRPLAVVTNKPERFALRILDHLGILGCFAAVVGGDTTDARKPSPQPLLAALARIGRPATRAWMVGDGLQDLAAGRAAGLGTIGVLYGYTPAATLRAAAPDLFWTSFGQVE